MSVKLKVNSALKSHTSNAPILHKMMLQNITQQLCGFALKQTLTHLTATREG